MLSERLDAASASFRVGYAATQFNREYSRLFGNSPREISIACEAEQMSLFGSSDVLISGTVPAM